MCARAVIWRGFPLIITHHICNKCQLFDNIECYPPGVYDMGSAIYVGTPSIGGFDCQCLLCKQKVELIESQNYSLLCVEWVEACMFLLYSDKADANVLYFCHNQ